MADESARRGEVLRQAAVAPSVTPADEEVTRHRLLVDPVLLDLQARILKGRSDVATGRMVKPCGVKGSRPITSGSPIPNTARPPERPRAFGAACRRRFRCHARRRRRRRGPTAVAVQHRRRSDVRSDRAARNLRGVNGFARSFPRFSTRATKGLKIPCGRPSCPATVDNNRSRNDVMDPTSRAYRTSRRAALPTTFLIRSERYTETKTLKMSSRSRVSVELVMRHCPSIFSYVSW